MAADRQKNADDILRQAATFAEHVATETSSNSLWREARDLMSRISQHQAIHGETK